MASKLVVPGVSPATNAAAIARHVRCQTCSGTGVIPLGDRPKKPAWTCVEVKKLLESETGFLCADCDGGQWWLAFMYLLDSPIPSKGIPEGLLRGAEAKEWILKRAGVEVSEC